MMDFTTVPEHPVYTVSSSNNSEASHLIKSRCIKVISLLPFQFLVKLLGFVWTAQLLTLKTVI